MPSPLKTNERVVFINDYSYTKKGTQGFYISHVVDSGYNVPLVIVDNDEYRRSMKRYGFTKPHELVKRAGLSMLFIDCQVVKPNDNDIISLRQVKEELDKIKKREKELEDIVILYQEPVDA